MIKLRIKKRFIEYRKLLSNLNFRKMKIGSKVVCIDDKHQYDFYKACPLAVVGCIYTIRGFRPDTGGLYLEEIELEFLSSGIERGFIRSRFREVDMQFGEKVTEKISKEILVEEESLIV